MDADGRARRGPGRPRGAGVEAILPRLGLARDVDLAREAGVSVAHVAALRRQRGLEAWPPRAVGDGNDLRARLPQAVLEAIDRGATCAEVASRAGVSPSTACRWALELGRGPLPGRGGRPRGSRDRRPRAVTRRGLARPDWLDDRVLALVQAGEGADLVAREAGVHPVTARRWMVKLGLAAPVKRAARSAIEAILPRLGLEPDAVLAREAGVSRERVRQLRAARGIAPCRRGRA